MIMTEITCKDLKRFWNKVKKLNNCWEWTASLNKYGYGTFYYNKKIIKAHRFSYEISKGLIPKRLELDHLCRNPKCVNPDHLEAVTHKENTLRGNCFSAINAKKTHCPQGHKYNLENTHISKKGERRCKTCRKRIFNNHYLTHKDQYKMYRKTYAKKHHEKLRLYQKKYREKQKISQLTRLKNG